MASVSVNQRVKGKGQPWRVMWRDATNRQRQRTFDRKADADAYAVKLERELLTGTYVDPDARRVTFGVQYATWRENRRVSASRHAAEDSLARHHVLPRWASTPLEAIAHDDLQAWVNELRPRYSWETTAACRQIARQVLAAAVRAKRIPHNPCEGIKVPDKERRDVTSDDVLEPAEIDRLVAAAPERWWTFLYCCAWLGYRLSEGLAIERRDVDLMNDTLTIRGTKTEAARRVLPLPRPAAALLRWHLEHFAEDGRPTALVFTEADGKKVTRYHARYVLERALAAAGLAGRGIDYRQLRHTAASLMLAAGVDPLDVQYRLGHRSYTTTANVYTHLMPQVRESGTARLERLMRGAR